MNVNNEAIEANVYERMYIPIKGYWVSARASTSARLPYVGLSKSVLPNERDEEEIKSTTGCFAFHRWCSSVASVAGGLDGASTGPSLRVFALSCQRRPYFSRHWPSSLCSNRCEKTPVPAWNPSML